MQFQLRDTLTRDGTKCSWKLSMTICNKGFLPKVEFISTISIFLNYKHNHLMVLYRESCKFSKQSENYCLS